MPVMHSTDEPPQKGPLLTNGHRNESEQDHPDRAAEMLHTKSTMKTDKTKPLSVDINLKAISSELSNLYSPAVEAKVWSVASKGLLMTEPPVLFPEYTRSNGKEYVYRQKDFWTSGFFPGTLYQLLYRSRAYPPRARLHTGRTPNPLKLDFACKWWTEELHSNAALTTTHDLGFMITPWARPAWELNGDARAFETLKLAARSLFSRYSPVVGLMRSWDVCITTRYHFHKPAEEFLVIIDNMMNLDMLFYVASQTKDQAMWDAAVQHARTTQTAHIRADNSSTHLIVFDPDTGAVRQHLTNQGYDDDSCWARGQAWAIAGFAETYGWTRDRSFLDTACKCADLFLSRLPKSGIPPWDFDAAQRSGDETQPPDASAAMIAAYGLLLIYKAHTELLESARAQTYLSAALHITAAVCGSQTDQGAHLTQTSSAVETVEQGVSQLSFEGVCNSGGDTIVTGATINNYRHAPRRWADHGLVYADYYFVLVGNLLLDLGIGRNLR